eukprot:1645931-Prymnesium_polylepis.2
MRGAHGETADFRGEHNAHFNLLSSRNFSLNALFQVIRYRATYSKRIINGSFVRAAFWTIRNIEDRTIHVEFRSTVATVRLGRRQFWVKHGAPPFVAGDVRVSVTGRRTVTVSNRRWRSSATSSWSYPHAYVLRLRVVIRPLYDTSMDPVAPHGCVPLKPTLCEVAHDSRDCTGTLPTGCTRDAFTPSPSRQAVYRSDTG